MLTAFLDEFGENLYMVTEYVHNDLRTILSHDRRLSLEQIRHVMYQLLQALSYMHHLMVVHRDLKPENILLTDDLQLRICDLGLARKTEPEMTGYLATRYYRAPEFMLTWRSYGAAVDVWSAGCIMAEMALGRLLFPATDHVSHLKLIMELVGSPSEVVLSRIGSPSTIQYLSILPFHSRADFQALFADILGPEGSDLLSRMLEFDPAARILSKEALQHPFFAELEPHPMHVQLLSTNYEGPRQDHLFVEAFNSKDAHNSNDNTIDWGNMLRSELKKYTSHG